MAGLDGHLELTAGVDHAGRTIIRRQSFSAPFHISKPHHDAGWLVVNLASPTPGLFSGDRVQVNVEVGPGAQLLLSTPAAIRLHSMGGGHAELQQSFSVAKGACLDVFPEYLIPQRSAKYRQRTRISIEEGGALLWCESIAPGRTASGEVFAYEELRFATDILAGSSHVLRERFRLRPGQHAVNALRARFPSAYYASTVCVAPELPSPADALHALHDPAVAWVGCSRLPVGGWIAKIIASDSVALRDRLHRAREIFYHSLGTPMPALRRVTGIV